MSSRRLIGVFEREEDTVEAIEASRQRGFKIVDVFGPHGSHEVERAMALPPSRIPWVVFALGLLGAGLKVWFEFWTTALRAISDFGRRRCSRFRILDFGFWIKLDANDCLSMQPDESPLRLDPGEVECL